jgi:hypothetical protein
MPLKILGWGTMVGVAFLAITSLKTWMAPLTARAAQMVRFVECLACPNGPQPFVSPRDLPRFPALHPFPVLVGRTWTMPSATLQTSTSRRLERPL